MKPTRKKFVTNRSKENKETVKVFCRIRPKNDIEEPCLKVISPTTVQLVNPEAVNKGGTYKEINYSFQHVFVEDSSQKTVFDAVALPLVENLVQGKNGLLFTYGVTGGGKTFTMNGDPHNGGIMPRCIDVIFNSIAACQAKKYVFKPDKMNGFEIQSEAEASLERANSLNNVNNVFTPRTPRFRKRDIYPTPARTPDSTKVSGVDEDSAYAVFVSYIEIYNNYIYDLLENTDERTKGLQHKMLRSDSNHSMYIHGVVEVEVKSSQDAFDVLYRGQKTKRMAHTILNSESSRSHSVFNIRLVQAPLDHQGESALCDKDAVAVSQLSLVDLAGSERTNRTQNKGQRLREAGNINNSLMTLRTCLEILRENQLQGTNKIIPYRDSKLTLLFKNFFEGDGLVHVVICVNPKAEDYDETLQVMKFAEMAQEVQVTRPPAIERTPGGDLLPGRRKANQIFKEAVQKLDEREAEKCSAETDIRIVYSLGPPFLSMDMNSEISHQMISSVTSYLETRIKNHNELRQVFEERVSSFRERLLERERSFILLGEEVNCLKASLENERKRSSALESSYRRQEKEIIEMQNSIASLESYIKDLENGIQEKDMQLNRQALDRAKVKQKLASKVATETEKANQEFLKKLRNQQQEVKDRDDKLRRVREILDYPSPQDGVNPLPVRTRRWPPAAPTSENQVATPKSASAPQGRTSVSDATNTPHGPETRHKAHRRSQSAGEVWLDHRSGMPAPLGTVFQPVLRKRKSVTKLTSVADITDPKISKYCLMTQEPDSAGEVETRLYKGDVVPTTTGGAQVVFNEMEALKQRSPDATSPKKRSSSEMQRDVQDLCSVAIEGHASAKKPRK